MPRNKRRHVSNPAQPAHAEYRILLPGSVEPFRAIVGGTNSSKMLQGEQKDVTMLWTVFVVLLILWLLGFSLHVGGGLIHLLLVVGLVVLVINLVSGRRTAV